MLISNGASTGVRYPPADESQIFDCAPPSPLLLAIQGGRSDIVAMLLQDGAATNVGEREIAIGQEYPLHAAVRFENLEILHMLLKQGPTVDCVDFV
jgi:ankyrin repeat protein